MFWSSRFVTPAVNRRKPIVVALLLLIALGVILGCGGESTTTAPEPLAQKKVAVVSMPEVAPVGTAVALAPDKPLPRIAALEPPADLRVVVQASSGKRTVGIAHKGHLVSLLRGDKVVMGLHAASILVEADEPIIWESSDRKTSVMSRGDVVWSASSAGRGKPSLRVLEQLVPTHHLEGGRHECRAYAMAPDVFSLHCYIDAFAVDALRPFAHKPRNGIHIHKMDTSCYVRVNLDTANNEFDAVAIVYLDGLRRHVIRGEASRLPNEQRASFSLLASARVQPQHPVMLVF